MMKGIRGLLEKDFRLFWVNHFFRGIDVTTL